MKLFIFPKMRRGQHAAAAILLSGGLTGALAAPSFAAPSLAAPITLTATVGGHVPDLVKTSDLLGTLPANQAVLFSVTLPLRNQNALSDLLFALNDPRDPRYGRYLTPAQFADQYGPTPAQYQTLIAYLQSKGLAVTQTFPSRTYVTVAGTAGQTNAAFGISLKQFRSPDGRVFHAPDTEVKVPIGIAGIISAVTGLDDATPPKPLLHLLHKMSGPPKSVRASVPAYTAMDEERPTVQDPGEQGTGPQGGFGPADLKTAYGLSGTALSGAGQTIAMVEYGTNFNLKDILKYENAFGLPRTPITIVPVDGGVTTYSSAATETNLDIDMQIALAPGAAQILVFLQPNAGSAADALNAVLNDGRAKQLSVSYGFGTESRTSSTPSASQTALNTVYSGLAATGVSVYVSSGDSGSAPTSTGTRVQVDINASQPMVCSVGGTALVVQSPGVNENYLGESVWNYNNTPSGGAGGGGISAQWTIAPKSYTISGTTYNYPGVPYQVNAAKFASAVTGSNVSATMRNIPDVSLVGSPETGVALYSSVDPTLSGPGWYVFGGTSASAPLWAGFTALVNQNRTLAGLPLLGFPNNSLYPLAYSASGLNRDYTNVFHDIADGNSNSTITGGLNFADVTGFDDSTGLGTFQGTNLITALSGGILVK